MADYVYQISDTVHSSRALVALGCDSASGSGSLQQGQGLLWQVRGLSWMTVAVAVAVGLVALCNGGRGPAALCFSGACDAGGLLLLTGPTEVAAFGCLLQEFGSSGRDIAAIASFLPLLSCDAKQVLLHFLNEKRSTLLLETHRTESNKETQQSDTRVRPPAPMRPPLFSLFLPSCLRGGNCDLRSWGQDGLCQSVAADTNGTNLVISPAGMTPLEILQFGARGNSGGQRAETLGHTLHMTEFMHAVPTLPSSSQGSETELACTLFVQAKTPFPCCVEQVSWWASCSLQPAKLREPNSSSQAKKWCPSRAQMEPSGTSCSTPTVQKIIKSWSLATTSRKHDSTTNGGPGSLTQDQGGPAFAQLVLGRAMSFQSTWWQRFPFMDTQFLPFTCAQGLVLQFPIMYQTAEVNYSELLLHQPVSKVRGAREQYSPERRPGVCSERLGLFLGGSLCCAECGVSKGWGARRLREDREEKPISCLTFPSALSKWTREFRIQNYFSLSNTLNSWGVTDLFELLKANLKEIFSNNSSSKIFGIVLGQDGFYVFGENHKGTKAPAATALFLLKRSLPIFKADWPFIFFLREHNTGFVFCIGRVSNPLD
ncbi:LOW QUALITY PROTEIN: serpin E3 [Molossus nigricans]